MYAPDNTSPFDLGTLATYICDDGFHLDLSVGSETRTCVEDFDGNRVGVFDGEAPSCIRMFKVSIMNFMKLIQSVDFQVISIQKFYYHILQLSSLML